MTRPYGQQLLYAVALLVCVPVASISQTAPPVAAPAQSAAGLSVGGDVATPLTLSPAELKSLPRTKAEIREEGRTIVYEGVLVGEILKRAGVPLGSELRGNAMATYVLAHASDGYQVLFSLAELDPGFTGSEIIVADTIDGKPLFAYQGPFRIVAPKDSRGARSIRMLQRLDVVRLRK
jgi:DMSO/TMAO reductase YedYZ molybdopterin-dependent catalytic subunit